MSRRSQSRRSQLWKGATGKLFEPDEKSSPTILNHTIVEFLVRKIMQFKQHLRQPQWCEDVQQKNHVNFVSRRSRSNYKKTARDRVFPFRTYRHNCSICTQKYFLCIYNLILGHGEHRKVKKWPFCHVGHGGIDPI